MKRGEAWWVSFDPALGGEIKKTRPAIILSNDAANAALNRVQVVPLTGNVQRIYPSEALVVLNGKPSKAMADQLATVSKKRMEGYIALVSPDEMEGVEQAVRVQLGLYE